MLSDRLVTDQLGRQRGPDRGPRGADEEKDKVKFEINERTTSTSRGPAPPDGRPNRLRQRRQRRRPRSVRVAPRVLRVDHDGIIGDHTVSVANAIAPTELCVRFMVQRLMAMVSLPTWQTFGPGWARRLCALPYAAVQMTNG